MAKKKSANAAKIRAVLRREGFSELAIRASIARMRQESALNPKAIRKNDAGEGNHSIGLFQWNRDRLKNGKKFAKANDMNWDDVETQALYYAKEVKGEIGGEAKWGQQLLSAKTPEQAAEAAISLARPKGWKASNPRAGHGWKNTINWTMNPDAAQKGEHTIDYGEKSQPFRLDALSELIHTHNLAEGNDPNKNIPTFDDSDSMEADPIDNSPEAVFKQVLAGVGEALQKGAAKTKERLDSAPGLSPIFGDELRAAASAPPDFNSILGMIQGMKS